MKYRKLRIAWSVGWGIACLLIIALWVRSYSKWDAIRGTSLGNQWRFYSLLDRLVVETFEQSTNLPWRYKSYGNPWSDGEYIFATEEGKFRRYVPQPAVSAVNKPLGFGIEIDIPTHKFNIAMPHWFVVAMLAGFAVLPWFRWRFSLRTLLIATTIIAVGLGLIVLL